MEESDMRNRLVSFKGIKEGIYILIDEGDFEKIKEELERNLESKLDFFEGSKILGIKSNYLLEEEKEELSHIITEKYNLSISSEGLPQSLEGSEEFYTGLDEGITRFINSTIRSGQEIEYNGNIVIIGDVNPGAIIKAKGNIIILGTFKGVAHAGADGNKEAIVAATDLRPTQLRIADIIVRKPDGEFKSSGLPEVAKVFNNEIYIEPYLPRK